jgi:hypothetical protein
MLYATNMQKKYAKYAKKNVICRICTPLFADVYVPTSEDLN